MELGEIKELLLNELTKEQRYLLNTKQQGEALELLNSLDNDSASLVFLDPQYEPVSKVLSINYPLSFQSDYQILKILEQIQRILKPSSFCLLWVNKTLLGNDRVPLWLLKTSSLKIVDCLVWHKKSEKCLHLEFSQKFSRIRQLIKKQCRVLFLNPKIPPKR